MANETTTLDPGHYAIPNDCSAFVRAGRVYVSKHKRTLDEIRKRSQAKSPEQQRKEQTDYMRYKAKYLREKGLLK